MDHHGNGEAQRIPHRTLVVLLLAIGASCASATPIAELGGAIAARLLLMDDVARYKWNHTLPVVDAERETALLERVTVDAVGVGLPEAYARRVVAAQIDASRAVQLELVSEWKRRKQAPFAGVPDLAEVQRPAIDAATQRLLQRLRAATCALPAEAARNELRSVPASLAQHPTAWSIAIAALWPVPDDACPHPD